MKRWPAHEVNAFSTRITPTTHATSALLPGRGMQALALKEYNGAQPLALKEYKETSVNLKEIQRNTNSLTLVRVHYREDDRRQTLSLRSPKQDHVGRTCRRQLLRRIVQADIVKVAAPVAAVGVGELLPRTPWAAVRTPGQRHHSLAHSHAHPPPATTDRRES